MPQLPSTRYQLIGFLLWLAYMTAMQLLTIWQNRKQLEKQEAALKNQELGLKKQDMAIQKADVVIQKAAVIEQKTTTLEEKVNGLTEARVEAAKDVGAMEERRRIQGGSHD